MNSTFSVFVLAVITFCSYLGAEEMDGDGLKEIISELAEGEVSGAGNVMEFFLEGFPVICIFDEGADRMRFLSPIIEYTEVSDKQRDAMMEANFHSALDARYCVSGGTLFAAYVHPLSPLRKEDVYSGLYQVVSLHGTFGGEYSSGLLQFGGDEEEPDQV